MGKRLSAARRGDTLVECILAAALAAAVFVPALSALRLLERNDRSAQALLEEAVRERHAFLRTAAEERLGFAVPDNPSKAVGFPPIETASANPEPERTTP